MSRVGGSEGRLPPDIIRPGANVSPLRLTAVWPAIPGVKIRPDVGVPHDTLGEKVVTCVRAPCAGLCWDEAAIREFF